MFCAETITPAVSTRPELPTHSEKPTVGKQINNQRATELRGIRPLALRSRKRLRGPRQGPKPLPKRKSRNIIRRRNRVVFPAAGGLGIALCRLRATLSDLSEDVDLASKEGPVYCAHRHVDSSSSPLPVFPLPCCSLPITCLVLVS